jgi:hypothetical protein
MRTKKVEYHWFRQPRNQGGPNTPRDYSLLPSIRTAHGAYRASYLVGTTGSFPRGKAPTEWSCTSTHLYIFMAWCLIKHRSNFTLTFLKLKSTDHVVHFIVRHTNWCAVHIIQKKLPAILTAKKKSFTAIKKRTNQSCSFGKGIQNYNSTNKKTLAVSKICTVIICKTLYRLPKTSLRAHHTLSSKATLWKKVLCEEYIFWDIAPCSPLSVNRHFRGTYRLYLQGRKNKLSNEPAWNQVASWALISCPAYVSDPKDGGDIFLRNAGCHSTDYTALYTRRWYSS